MSQFTVFAKEQAMAQPNPQKALTPNRAISLWAGGVNNWNDWVEKNPIADVSFKGLSFSQYRGSAKNTISFFDYNFPKGDIDFSGITFGDGDINFSGANFGKGNVSFSRANFGNGNISFSETKFGEANIDFTETNFGEGNIDFEGATFEERNVRFRATTFGNGNVSFKKTKFGEGDIDFIGTTFEEGNVSFNAATFGGGKVDFKNVKFRGNSNFSELQDCDRVKSFSFRNVSFDQPFTISGDFGCVVDLVGTKTSHHVELSGLKCYLQKKSFLGFLEVAKYPKDIARLRRLKELAELNRHHEASLHFHADEMRAKRWHETKYPASFLDMLFSFFSDYGQSIWRPVLALVVLTFISPFVSDIPSKVWEFMDLGIDKEAIKVAIANSLPFLSASRSLAISITSIFHQLIALVFIFLIGLGLRNHFRI